MAYILQSDIKGMIPEALLTQALDDNGDGQADIGVWDCIALDVQKAIDGPLAAAYAVPFATPLPDILQEAAKVFACELLYQRRGYAANVNPWTKRADECRAQLKAIADGSPLPGLTRTAPAPILISEDAKTTTTSGRILA